MQVLQTCFTPIKKLHAFYVLFPRGARHLPFVTKKKYYAAMERRAAEFTQVGAVVASVTQQYVVLMAPLFNVGLMRRTNRTPPPIGSTIYVYVSAYDKRKRAICQPWPPRKQQV